MSELDASLFAPGHGEWITDPRAKINEYVTHRQHASKSSSPHSRAESAARGAP